jgi:hypothetical protein
VSDATTTATGRWVRAWATDIAPGDLVRIDSREHRVISRTYPPVTSPLFKARFPGGTRTLGKLSRVEIRDEDGTVAVRVRAVINWKRP